MSNAGWSQSKFQLKLESKIFSGPLFSLTWRSRGDDTLANKLIFQILRWTKLCFCGKQEQKFLQYERQKFF